jgi:hypothetical protein
MQDFMGEIPSLDILEDFLTFVKVSEISMKDGRAGWEHGGRRAIGEAQDDDLPSHRLSNRRRPQTYM